MDIRTYRAASMQEALELVRKDLGPDASVLHARETSDGWMRWMTGGKEIEVVASNTVEVPSRMPPEPRRARHDAPASVPPPHIPPPGRRLPAERPEPRAAIEPAEELDYRARFRRDLKHFGDDLPATFAGWEEARPAPQDDPRYGSLVAWLEAAGWNAKAAGDLAARALEHASLTEEHAALRRRVLRLIEEQIAIAGPIQLPPGERRVVALVGPTGVGKTTTIAKLAAHFRLHEKRRVGLITIDTFRIAAVDQLRTYAELLDVPMEVVATPRELTEALGRLSGVDLVLIDTAGRSPRDEVKLHELARLLAAAEPQEVHLVLSCVASEASQRQAVQQFRKAGATAVALTKLDEAAGLGSLGPILAECRLGISYTTDGQNVPDDLAPADRRQLAAAMVNARP